MPAGPATPGWRVPRYDDASLGALLPGVAAALGAPLADPVDPAAGLPAVDLPPAERYCVVLVDGMGWTLLAETIASSAGRRAVPFLAEVLSGGESRPVSAGTPSTTATSMASFGTGLPPGRHGLVGLEVLDPDRGVLLNELRWDPATDPEIWQPFGTVFGRLAAAGVGTLRIGNPEFAGSGLTVAAHRGGAFLGVDGLASRVDTALSALRGGGSMAGPDGDLPVPAARLVQVYWGDLDAAGHAHGWHSGAWRRELRRVDTQLARLAAGLAPDTRLVVTADHGMVDAPPGHRLDLAEMAPRFDADIALVGGEPRFVQLYLQPAGRARRAALVTELQDLVGDRAQVCTRDDAIGAGWFGPVENWVGPRIGEVIVAADDETFTLVDSRVAHPHLLRLVGQHGSLTEAEQLVPVLLR
ncbi:alkaline phosphatase family protein [Nakamurella leprariae]|uniref:Alkaline phosphatase family protein n=1 Tax=Nakamurella leprariae TaxID=2803911 RepID=A0A938Y834_9ACTN|nr:nucleotide pyrophosphatase/phosphodiesterase family protein [Nakamurella leprariae]MBM9467761.1 alkaline phosphatase family protein [Nakamurella leprariae]